MSKPITRKEEYLAAAAGDKVDYPAYPITREEAYLEKIAQGGGIEANTGETPTGTLESLKIGDDVYAVPSGGGGGGTSDYSALNNKPQINSVELSGNKTTSNLGINADNVMMSDGVTSVESVLNYSETEHVVGTWIDGKTVYEKVVNLGSLPNNTSKRVQHNVSNMDKIIDMRVIATATSSSDISAVMLNFPAGSNNIRLTASRTFIQITSTYDVSNYSGYAILRYTKTS